MIPTYVINIEELAEKALDEIKKQYTVAESKSAGFSQYCTAVVDGDLGEKASYTVKLSGNVDNVRLKNTGTDTLVAKLSVGDYVLYEGYVGPKQDFNLIYEGVNFITISQVLTLEVKGDSKFDGQLYAILKIDLNNPTEQEVLVQ